MQALRSHPPHLHRTARRRESKAPAAPACPAEIIRSMHGLLHIELERFARAQVGDAAWEQAVTSAGLAGRAYVTTDRYDDAEALALVVALAKVTEIGPQALLEGFGRALVPALLSNFSDLVPAQWRTLELVENTEELIHTALRASDQAARPPMLRVLRRNADEVLVIYASERRMCGVAKGIARGLGDHFDEAIEVEEESCMLTGASSCSIAIRRLE
jgi:predicted hydrocarbon binding protein